MDKDLYHSGFPVSKDMFPEVEQYYFKNRSWEFNTVCAEKALHETLNANKIVILEQYRWTSKKGYSDMELAFFFNLSYYSEITDISIKLINYWNRIFLWAIEGIDANWHFLQVEPFACLTNQEDLNRLMLLWNQRNLYIHLYSWGEVVKTIVISNQFRRDSQIEEIFKKIDTTKLKSTYMTQDEIKVLMDKCMETLWRETIQAILNQPWVFFELT